MTDGYFITKQPSPEELKEKISFFTARQREETFFRQTAPWCNRPGLVDRMGTPQLTKALSKLLGGVINQAYVALYPAILHSRFPRTDFPGCAAT